MIKAIILGSSQSVENYPKEIFNSVGIEFVGYIDPLDSTNADIINDYLQFYETIQKADVFLISSEVYPLDIDFIKKLTRFGKHLLIDGFRNWSTYEIEQLEKLRIEAQTIIQFGSLLQSLPIFTTAFQYLKNPRMIKIEKFCNAPRLGDFENWVFENIAEEIDLVCRIVRAGIRSIQAKPIFIYGNQADLINIHLEFDNDAICNISMGRAIEDSKHFISIFQQDKHIQINLKDNKILESKMALNQDQLELDIDIDQSENPKIITIERNIMPYDVRKMELRNFTENIEKKLTPSSTLDHLRDVEFICEMLNEKIKRRYQAV